MKIKENTLKPELIDYLKQKAKESFNIETNNCIQFTNHCWKIHHGHYWGEEYMNISSDQRGYQAAQDTWIRPATAHATLTRSTGTLSIPLRFSWAVENKSSYMSGMITTAELACITDTDFQSILDLMHLVGNVTTSDMATPHSYLSNLPTPLPYDEGLKEHLKW